MTRDAIIVAIAGVSASGKTTTSEALQSAGLKVLRSVTTRPRRHLETNEDYQFVSEDEFASMIDRNDLAEYQKFGKHWYGLSNAELDSAADSVVVLTVGGLQQIMRSPFCENKTIIPVFLNCSRRTMLKRMRGRGDSWKHVLRRCVLATPERIKAKRAGIEFVDAEQPIMDISVMIKMKVGFQDPELLMLLV